VIQRVNYGRVTIEGRVTADIGKGLVILLGIGPGDDAEKSTALAKKIAQLRIMEDARGKMNLSILDTGGSAVVVSQFTLFADTRKGNRPSFTEAAPPQIASPLVDHFVAQLRGFGIPVQTGEFGAHMLVALENDGPVTIWIEN
jgi:D-tyrosyl-tRNA(Tyr) deacylase